MNRTMLYSGAQVVSRIKGHIKRRGGVYGAWFVGVCTEPRNRLFKLHGVEEKGDFWILMHAKSSQVARRVKSYLVSKIGVSGGGDADDKSADFVYAYKKNEHTKP